MGGWPAGGRQGVTDFMAWRPAKRVRPAFPKRGVGALLAGMRVRKKLVFLHTCFSLVLAGVLALAMRPAVREVVRQAEQHESMLVLDLALAERAGARASHAAPDADPLRVLRARLGGSATIQTGTAESIGIEPSEIGRVRAQSYGSMVRRTDGSDVAAAYDPATGEFVAVNVTMAGARAAVTNLYILVTVALLAVYALVALALEMFVLPEHVYSPIRTMLTADQALLEGRTEAEIIPEASMPLDELGDIMHSRNESIRSLRRHESALAAALQQLSEVATDLRKKNHLLETARQNLADADRLASLGMMSAGIAHELNTPLSVLKGMVEQVHQSANDGGAANVKPEDAALMLRVVGRLERLSESLLDLARVRPHRSLTTPLRALVDEAWMLVRLDRGARSIVFTNAVPDSLTAWCDPDRILQVLVNLLRNAADAVGAGGAERGGGSVERGIEVRGERLIRDGRPWASLRTLDTGPGIAPEMLERMFQPFASTRLDAHGTGLGLAVSEGIIREHGGVILARNRADRAGAEFEVLLPEADDAAAGAPPSAEAPRFDAGPVDSSPAGAA